MHGTPINSIALCAHGNIVGLGPDVCFLHRSCQETVGKCSGSDTKEEDAGSEISWEWSWRHGLVLIWFYLILQLPSFMFPSFLVKAPYNCFNVNSFVTVLTSSCHVFYLLWCLCNLPLVAYYHIFLCHHPQEHLTKKSNSTLPIYLNRGLLQGSLFAIISWLSFVTTCYFASFSIF